MTELWLPEDFRVYVSPDGSNQAFGGGDWECWGGGDTGGWFGLEG